MLFFHMSLIQGLLGSLYVIAGILNVIRPHRNKTYKSVLKGTLLLLFLGKLYALDSLPF